MHILSYIKGCKWPFILLFFKPLFLILAKNNIWVLYDSYHKNPTELKRRVWNEFMIRHTSSISIDATIKSPLILPHGFSGIFITQYAEIGSNVVVFQQVTIGSNTIKGSKSYGAPVIDDNVLIGAGAKVIGGVHIGNNVRIGANAVASVDVEPNSVVVVGTRIIKKETELDNTFIPTL